VTLCCMLQPDYCGSLVTDTSSVSEAVLYYRGIMDLYYSIFFYDSVNATGVQLFSNSEWDVAIATVQPCAHSSDILVVSAVNVLIGCCHARQVPVE